MPIDVRRDFEEPLARLQAAAAPTPSGAPVRCWRCDVVLPVLHGVNVSYSFFPSGDGQEDVELWAHRWCALAAFRVWLGLAWQRFLSH